MFYFCPPNININVQTIRGTQSIMDLDLTFRAVTQWVEVCSKIEKRNFYGSFGWLYGQRVIQAHQGLSLTWRAGGSAFQRLSRFYFMPCKLRTGKVMRSCLVQKENSTKQPFANNIADMLLIESPLGLIPEPNINLIVTVILMYRLLTKYTKAAQN